MLKKKRRENARRRRPYRRYIWLLPLIGLSVILLQPRWFFSLADRVKPGALYRVDMAEGAPKMIALTIDDGPSEKTAEILDVLDRYGAKATFFNISGNVAGYEDLLVREIKESHELGNHLTADEPSALLELDAFERDLLAAEAVLRPYATGALRWLRPGMGWYSAGMVEVAERHGYRVVLGSVFPYDTHLSSAEFASKFILYKVRSGDVIVLHDGEAGRSDRTIATLEKILPALVESGYRVTTLSELVAQSEPDKVSRIKRYTKP